MDLFYLCLQTGSTDGMRVSTLNVSCMAGPNKVLPCLGQDIGQNAIVFGDMYLQSGILLGRA